MSGRVTAPRVRAVGLHTGWGRGAAAVPASARAASAGRDVVPLDPSAGALAPYVGERFRRATRECLWALASVQAMLEDDGAAREAIAGDRTALIFVTAAVYAASNRAFIEGGGGTHFAYTAPAVVPAEVAIEFGLTGASTVFIGGPPATLHAIRHAATLLHAGACDRALVLAVETFAECEDLYRRGRRLAGRPLVEAAACLWLEPGEGTLRLEDAGTGSGGPRGADAVRRRVGETFACEPLAALALWHHAGHRTPPGVPPVLCGRWRGERVQLRWSPDQGRGNEVTAMEAVTG